MKITRIILILMATIMMASVVAACGTENKANETGSSLVTKSDITETEISVITPEQELTPEPKPELTPESIIVNGLLTYSHIEFIDKLSENLKIIDENFTATLAGESSDKVFGGVAVSFTTSALIQFLDNNDMEIGGSGKKRNVIDHIDVIFTENDNYQRTVILTAVLLTLDNLIDVDTAEATVDKAVQSVGIPVKLNGFTYVWDLFAPEESDEYYALFISW